MKIIMYNDKLIQKLMITKKIREHKSVKLKLVMIYKLIFLYNILVYIKINVISNI